MSTRIAVIAQKGGVGKTTVTANLGAAIASFGQRVLLVDCDPQGSLAAALGVAPEPPTLVDVLSGQASAAAAARPTATPGLSLLPAGLDLSDVEFALFGQSQWYLALDRALAGLDGYDVILLDTPPGLGVLAFLAVQASTAALIVCPPEYLAHRALGHALATVERARQMTPALRLLGIVPTLVSGRTREEEQVLAALHAEHGDLILSPIRRRIVLQEAARAGRPVVAHAPRSDAATAFLDLAEIVLARAS